MNKGIELFYKDKKIIATVWEQQIWFSMLDLEKFIDIDNALSDEKASINVDGNLLKMISEFGVYRLVCLGEFREWFIGDAILRIRKYGCYKLSIAEEKEKIIKEIKELQGGYLSNEKMKYSSLDKLRLERAKLEAKKETQEKEAEASKKRLRYRNEFPYSCNDLDGNYDLNRAMEDIMRVHQDVNEYWIHIDGREYLFSQKFFEHIDNYNYML